MNAAQQALYDRLIAFDIDQPEAKLSFTRRLARENGWDLEYARRVVVEYKRFIFLAIVAGHAVTPSQQVDQAWHLHLLYTRSYWDDFCGQVLGHRIHHGPTQGGAAEQAKYRDWYDQTKASYDQLLGESPPADIWPATHVRFGDDLYERWVNTRRNWVIPKPRIVPATAAWIAVALAALAIVCLIVLMPRHAGARDDAAVEKPAPRYRWVKLNDGSQIKQRVSYPSPREPSSPQHSATQHLATQQFVAQPIDSVQSSSRRGRQPTNHLEYSQPPHSHSKRRPQSNSGDDVGLIAYFAIWVGAIVFTFLCWLFTAPYACPSCKQSAALTLTSKPKETGNSGAAQQEWHCKHCGYRTWKDEPTSAGCGTCGCGGCGG